MFYTDIILQIVSYCFITNWPLMSLILMSLMNSNYKQSHSHVSILYTKYLALIYFFPCLSIFYNILICTSASSKAAWMSHFSCSTCFFIFSNSWICFPPSAICSVRSEISSVVNRKESWFRTFQHGNEKSYHWYRISRVLTLQVLILSF